MGLMDFIFFLPHLAIVTNLQHNDVSLHFE